MFQSLECLKFSYAHEVSPSLGSCEKKASRAGTKGEAGTVGTADETKRPSGSKRLSKIGIGVDFDFLALFVQVVNKSRCAVRWTRHVNGQPQLQRQQPVVPRRRNAVGGAPHEPVDIARAQKGPGREENWPGGGRAGPGSGPPGLCIRQASGWLRWSRRGMPT